VIISLEIVIMGAEIGTETTNETDTEEETVIARVGIVVAEAEATTKRENIVSAVHPDQVIADLSTKLEIYYL